MHRFTLAERTERFASGVRTFISSIPKNAMNVNDIDQLMRSSGSVAANYIEADEAFSKKDFIYRMKISRKEARESRLWLDLLNLSNDVSMESVRRSLSKEANELLYIFSAIIRKCEGK